MSKRFAATAKQREIMDLVLGSADAGRDLSFVDLHADLSYEATPQALQYSIRYLEQHGLLVRKYGAGRRLSLAPTLLAYQLIRPTAGEPVLEDPSPRS
ncbi:hypothetical protein [Methylobacterium sp. AMS5]|uniref:hypothetical protein n=1 Tax=Methylobacterium sp. AMS5 TaxID=925818 RepID=UPI00074FA1EE|nr:hypothetical protein [Methylobacterium sp. AMS5]AMB48276.1 hypothetical protein Y590_25245 [Methylobacterium sp. AMS5]